LGEPVSKKTATFEVKRKQIVYFRKHVNEHNLLYSMT